MGTKFYFILAIILCLLLAACGKETPPISQPSQGDLADNASHQPPPHPGAQTLVVYSKGGSPQLNEFHATNVKQGKPTFDFPFTPAQDGSMSLAMNTVKSTLLGCNDSDIGLQFSLYRAAADGSIDLSGYDSLGPSPISVKKGGQYVVRVMLSLNKDCLGLDYRFGIDVAPASPQ